MGREHCFCGLLLLLSGCASSPPGPDPRNDRAGPAQQELASKLLESGQTTPTGGAQLVTSFAAGVSAGDDAWRRKELDLAVFMYVQALGFNDRDGETLAKIGAIHETRGNLLLARKAFELAAERSPGDARIAERLGLLCLRLQDYPAAEKSLSAARAVTADRWQTHEGLGLVAIQARDSSAAIRHFDAALALEPRAPESRAGRGRAQFMAGNFDAAEADLKQALETGAGDWQQSARRDLGTLYAQRGRYADGLALLLEVMPEAQAYNRLGEIAIARADYGSAERMLNKALEASPTHFVAADRNRIIAREHLASAQQLAGAANTPAAVVSRGPLRATPSPAKVVMIAAADARANSSVRVREARDLESSVQGYLQAGDGVRIIESGDDWSFVEFTHRATGLARRGWVRSSYLDPASTASTRSALP
jgi:tetratricopeptide (TPR) repeat protein